MRHLLRNRAHTERLHEAASQLTEQTLAGDSVSRNALSLRILVVEDNLDALGSTRELLIHLGHRPVGEASAEAAISSLRDGAFDVLMTDLNLPGVSGEALARQAIALQPSLRVVIASGMSGVDVGIPGVAGATGSHGAVEQCLTAPDNVALAFSSRRS